MSVRWGSRFGASLVKAAVVVGERAIAEAWNVQNLPTAEDAAFNELSRSSILASSRPPLCAIREVGKERASRRRLLR